MMQSPPNDQESSRLMGFSGCWLFGTFGSHKGSGPRCCQVASGTIVLVHVARCRRYFLLVQSSVICTCLWQGGIGGQVQMHKTCSLHGTKSAGHFAPATSSHPQNFAGGCVPGREARQALRASATMLYWTNSTASESGQTAAKLGDHRGLRTIVAWHKCWT